MNFVYVVMWESLHGGDCTGGDIYMSLDYDKAKEFMDKKARIENRYELQWDEEHDMWISRWKYGWDKLYIDSRELDMEY